MNLRITPQAQLTRQMSYLRRQTDELTRLQTQASTGLKLQDASDDPLGMVALLAARSEDGRIDTHQANLAGARDQLERGNSTLLEAGKLFVRARQLALEGATGTTTPSERDAMAIEVDRLIDQLLTTANSSVDGRHLYGGTATDRPPFAVTAVDLMNRPLTISYQGSDTRATVPVGRGQPIDVLYQGDRVFQQPGQDGFAALVGLRDELRNAAGLTDAQQAQLLTQRVQAITEAHEGILGAVGEMSASLEAIESMDYRLGDLRVQVKSHMGDLESADMAEVVVNLRTQESLFSSALQISARLFDQSLMDYLR